MRRGGRIALRLAGGMALLVAGLALAAVFFVPIDRLRPKVEARLSEAIGVPVTLGRLSLSFGRGVWVRTREIRVGPSTGSQPSTGESLAASGGRVRLGIRALLRKEVAIYAIEIESAEIRRASTVLWRDGNLAAAIARQPGGSIRALGSCAGVFAAVPSAPAVEAEFDAELVEDRLLLRRVTIEGADGTVALHGAIDSVRSRSPSVALEAEGTLGRSRGAASIAATSDERRTDVRLDLSFAEVRAEDLARLAPFLAAATGSGAGEPSAGSSDEKRSTRALGKIRAERAKLGVLDAENLSTGLRYEAGRLELEDVTLDLYGGRQTGSVSIDLSRSEVPFHLATQARDVNLARLGRAFDPEGPPVLEGNGRLEVDLRGNAPGAQLDRRSLRGSVALHVGAGRMANLGVLAQVATLADRADRGTISRADTPFRSLDARFLLADGTARAETIALRSDDVDVVGNGSVGLEGALDIDLLASISPAITASLEARAPSLRHWIDADGRLAVPMTLAGTLAEPRVRMDVNRAASAGLARLLEKKGSRKVLERLFGGR